MRSNGIEWKVYTGHMNHSDIFKSLISASSTLNYIYPRKYCNRKRNGAAGPSLLSLYPLNAIFVQSRNGIRKGFNAGANAALAQMRKRTNHNNVEVDSKKCHWKCNVSVIHCHCEEEKKTNKRRPWTYTYIISHRTIVDEKPLEIHTWNGFDGFPTHPHIHKHNKSKRKIRRIDKIYIHFRCVGLNGIYGVFWSLVVATAMPALCKCHANAFRRHLQQCICEFWKGLGAVQKVAYKSVYNDLYDV